ncbi:MAG: response regulator [Vicinamibacterales bacterium]
MGSRRPPDRPILVVDDEADIRDLLGTVLRLHGYQVVEARNGVEAYNVARAERPALILLDLMMPVMSGVEFRRAQLANPDIRKIPVIVISAHHDVKREVHAMKVVAFLVKPLDIEMLEQVVNKHAARH